MTIQRARFLPAIVLAAALASPLTSHAQSGAKRAEGRYFIELAEIFLSSDQFDVVVAEIEAVTPESSEAVGQQLAEMPRFAPTAPSLTVGLNRPSGKTSFWVNHVDFDFTNSRVPADFNDTTKVVTSSLLPPGTVYRRTFPTGETAPNYGNEFSYIRRVDYKSADLTVERNIRENERFRLRWMAGLKYAQFRQTLQSAVSYAKEYRPLFPDSTRNIELQDFFLLEGQTATKGFGPKIGINGRYLAGKNKKWSLQGSAELAFIPESTNASYSIFVIDETPYLLPNQVRDIFGRIRPVPPLLPGIEPSVEECSPCIGRVDQHGFSDMTYLFNGKIGFRYQPRSFFGIGIDIYQMRWHGLISQMGLVDTVHEGGRFEIVPGERDATDPQLRDTELRVTAPTFSRRDDFVFDGISLNLLFDF